MLFLAKLQPTARISSGYKIWKQSKGEFVTEFRRIFTYAVIKSI